MANPPVEWTVLSMLEWATDFFKEKGIRNPRFSIEWLLASVLGVKRLDLYLMYERPLTKEELDTLRPHVQRRTKHEPLQYITGETDFYNTTIKVKPGVLIPRMETEQLVDIVLGNETSESISVLDIGTGSGCIPIALKKHRENWNVFATDISTDALEIANQNATLNEVEIMLFEDDLFNSSIHTHKTPFDVIISNPPYIHHDEWEVLDKEVKEYEPSEALFCNSTLEMYSAIERLSQNLLVNDGTIYLELHERHAQEVREIFSSKNWSASIQKDYDNKPRFLVGKKLN